MRNVKRLSKPETLRRKGAEWTREIVSKAKTARQHKKAVPSKAYRYNKKDIRDALTQMYGGLCCYCESRVTHVAFAHIEHRMPKSRFPRKTYDWTNLNLACPKCNNAKGEKWTSSAPILDSVSDIPITDHLTYKVGKSGVRRWPASQRGETTVDHANLDRDDLVKQRNQVYLETAGTIDEIDKAKNSHSPAVQALIRELKTKINGEYGSLIQWMIESRLDDAA
jgi:uncharacterized protein (TIGR02646 family)